MEDLEKLFNDDIKQKKITARGIHGRASRTGKISKVKLPADFLGREYTRSSKPVSFSVDDVLYILQETPTLKELLMQRLDAEYEHYKLAIDRTVEAVARIQERALQAMLERINAVEQELDNLSAENSRLAKLLGGTQQNRKRSGRPRKTNTNDKKTNQNNNSDWINIEGQEDGVESGFSQGKYVRQEQILWSTDGQTLAAEKIILSPASSLPGGKRAGGRRPKTSEELKIKVFQKLDSITGTEKDVSFKTINSAFPGIQYYIYKLKVWDNYEAMIEEYLTQRQATNTLSGNMI